MVFLAVILTAGLVRAGDPFPLPAFIEPTFPARVFNVADYGAKADGSKGTAAFAAAMSACERAGGGRVLVPDGTWTTGPIHLGNNCELHLADNAVIRFTDDPGDYLPAVNTSWEGVECLNFSPLVYAFGKTNVAVTGHGTLAPQMTRWRQWMDQSGKGIRNATETLYHWCMTNAPVAGRNLRTLADANVRPPLLQMNRCRNVLLKGFRVRQSPFWVLHLYRSDDCILRDVDVLAWGANNDSLDVEMCRNVLVEDCTFYGGDDGLTLKSGRNRDGWNGRPTENVVIRRCDVRHSHGLVACGSELSGGIRNVLVEDCRGGVVSSVLSLKTNRRRGGFLENVTVRNVTVDWADNVLSVNQNAIFQWAEFPDYELRPTPMRDVTLENVRVKRARDGVIARGDPRTETRDIRFRNVVVEEVLDRSFDVKGVSGLDFADFRVESAAIPTDGYFVDLTANLDRYAILSPDFAKAVAFLKRPDLTTLPPGDYRLSDGAVATVRNSMLTDDWSKSETHDDCIVLLTTCGEFAGYSTFVAGTCPDPLPFQHLNNRKFALIYPGVRHAYGLSTKSPRLQREVLVKIFTKGARR